MRAFLIAALLAATALSSRAEVVFFSSGLDLRVKSFQVVGEMAAVELVEGGEIWFPLTVVDRVVADEGDLIPETRRIDPGSSAKNGSDAPPVTPDGEPIIEAARAEELDPAEPDPAGSISGTVLSETGDPVYGVDVRARAIRLFQAEGGIGGNRPEVQSRSDRDGLYRFEQLAQGEYGVHSLATDRYTAARTVVRTGADDANLVLNENRDVAIYGTVTNPQGEPLEEVSVAQVDRSAVAATTDHDGQYRLQLPVGGHGQTYTLGFEREGFGGRTLSLADSQVLGRNEVRLDARLEPLESLAKVVGKVSDPAGAPVAGETVFLVGEQQYQSVTDQAGQFLIPGVEAHTTYQLWISPRGPYRKYREKVRVSAEGLKVDVVLESESSEYASLSGRMIDAGGIPVPHFSLWLRSSNNSAGQPLLVTGDASGVFSVPEVPLGRLTFTTVSDPRLTINVPELSPGGAENVELILDSGGYEIRGRVLDSNGNPVVPAPLLTLEWSHHGGGLQSLSLRRSTADAYGFFVFTHVGPGLHSLRVDAPGFESAQLKAESPGELEVQLRANKQEGGPRGE